MSHEPEDTPEDAELPEHWNEEDAELDRLYREALSVVDSIERDMQLPWNEEAAGDDAAALRESEVSESSVALSKAPETDGEVDTATRPMESAVGGSAPRITPHQVLEAALFVGGEPLTTRRLVHLLRDEFSIDYVDEALATLNRTYESEGRPYEIRLVEGGWQLSLRGEYEKVRHKVYGLGPKEVKLSQEALEVLAVVAYHQPLSAEEIEILGKPAPNGALRQLLRRELVAIERGEGRKDIKYRTTDRFLQLFDLQHLNELPQAEEIAFK